MASRTAADFSRVLARLSRGFAERELPFMLIGGQAVLVHGRPRLTEDIDITLGIDPGGLPDVLDLCRELELVPLPEDVESFVQRTFVLPVADHSTGMRVDLIFSTTPYEEQAIERAVIIQVDGVEVPFATAEDLIIHKVFAGRPRDLEDAAGVIRRQQGALDWPYIERWIGEFAAVPGREGIQEEMLRLRAQAEAEPEAEPGARS